MVNSGQGRLEIFAQMINMILSYPQLASVTSNSSITIFKLPPLINPLCFRTSLDHHYYILVMMIEASDFKGLFMSHPHFPCSSFALFS